MGEGQEPVCAFLGRSGPGYRGLGQQMWDPGTCYPASSGGVTRAWAQQGGSLGEEGGCSQISITGYSTLSPGTKFEGLLLILDTESAFPSFLRPQPRSEPSVPHSYPPSKIAHQQESP